MSSTSAINPKGARQNIATSNPLTWVCEYLCSTVGQKILVAITGASLVTFVVFHMIGNLKMFSGPESINKYAYFLKHDLGLLIWIARAGLLGCFTLHVLLAVWLKARSAAARPIGYVYSANAQATPMSKMMLQTGLVIGAFVVFHLAHFTFAMVHGVPASDGKGIISYLDLKDFNGHHDVYRMVIAGFQSWWISVIYSAAQVVLYIHLTHGIQSVFQTLGLVNRRFVKIAKLAGYAIALTILLGNLSIVIAVWGGWLK